MAKGKELMRAQSRRGTADRKTASSERRSGRLREPTLCKRCGALFSDRQWRQRHRATHALLGRAAWVECPACRQAGGGEYWGRVLVRGPFARANEAVIRQRIRNVEARARFTQPQRRVVSADRSADVLEVLTTSQKLAHRIVHELKKLFRGRATYRWSDDGSLFAVWERD